MQQCMLYLIKFNEKIIFLNLNVCQQWNVCQQINGNKINWKLFFLFYKITLHNALIWNIENLNKPLCAIKNLLMQCISCTIWNYCNSMTKLQWKMCMSNKIIIIWIINV